ncbi:MAG: EamA family transporter, partial [Caldilineales bacterium]|nr:EamA family transporter [Caldilineales bacterium]
LIGLGLIPLGLGHTLYNAALRRTHATYVNVIATQEVTGGILLGILLLGEIPGLNEVIGAAVTLLGVLLVIL